MDMRLYYCRNCNAVATKGSKGTPRNFPVVTGQASVGLTRKTLWDNMRESDLW